MTEEGQSEQPAPAVSGQDDSDESGLLSDNPSGSSRYAAKPASPLACGLGFALVAALMAVQPLAATTYLKLFYEKGDQLIQPSLPEGIPAPRSLVWSPRLYGFIGSLGTLPSAAVLGIYILFSLCFLYGLFRILNPTFRMTTGVDWDRHLLVKTYMHSEPITKAFLIAIAAAVPAFALWQLVGWALGENALSLWLRLVMTGAALWFLFSQDGIAGDFESGSYEPPRGTHLRRSLLFRGSLAGTAGWVMLRSTPALSTDELFSAYRAIGFIGPGQWREIVLITVGFAALFGFAAGGIAAALGSPRWTWARRIRAAMIPCLALVAAAYFGRVWLPAHFERRYDYHPNSRLSAESRIIQICRLSPVASPQTAFLIDVGRAVPVQFSGSSVTGIAATPGNAHAIESYLKSRDYRTALSYAAYTTLHDTALLRWSVDDVLRVYLMNLSGAPDVAYVSHLLNKLQGTAFSPSQGVLSAAERLADDRSFDFSDRRAWVLVGDIYARFGVKEKAAACYRHAEMPASQVTIRADERTLSPDGKVVGRLLFAGKPVAGARVGLMAEQAVTHLGNMTDAGTHFTSPFWLSWLGASTATDAQGRFTLSRLLYGRCVVLVQLPSELYGGSAPLTAAHGPGTITVRPSAPPVDLLDIALGASPVR